MSISNVLISLAVFVFFFVVVMSLARKGNAWGHAFSLSGFVIAIALMYHHGKIPTARASLIEVMLYVGYYIYALMAFCGAAFLPYSLYKNKILREKNKALKKKLL